MKTPSTIRKSRMSLPNDQSTFEEIIKSAIDTFGKDLQMVVAIEEMTELTKVITKVLRYGMKKHYRNDAKEEIADVMIMLLQLMRMFELSEDDIAESMSSKIKRLQGDILRRKGQVSQT